MTETNLNLNLDPKAAKAAERAAAKEAKAAERAAKRTVAKTEKASRPERAAKPSKRAKKPSPLQPASTSFDFLNGAYAKTRNTRLMNYVILGVFTAVVLVLVGTGLNNYLSLQEESQNVAALEAEKNEANRLVASRGNGLTEEQMKAHVAARTAEVKKALASEIDTVQVLNDVSAAAPSGVVISGITFGAPAPAAPQAGAEAEAPKAAPTAGAAPAAAAGTTVTIVASASTYEQLAAWDKALTGIGYLQGAETEFTGLPGNQGGLSITTTATLGPGVTGARLNEIVPQLTVPGEAPAAAPAAPADPSAPVPPAGGAK